MLWVSSCSRRKTANEDMTEEHATAHGRWEIVPPREGCALVLFRDFGIVGPSGIDCLTADPSFRSAQ